VAEGHGYELVPPRVVVGALHPAAAVPQAAGAGCPHLVSPPGWCAGL
jgi:hypothetical protein